LLRAILDSAVNEIRDLFITSPTFYTRLSNYTQEHNMHYTEHGKK